MHSSLKQVAQIAKKETKTIVGLMSGTSLDGLDIALCKVSGSGGRTAVDVEAFKTIAYATEFREQLQNIAFKEHVDLQKLCLFNSYIGDYFAELVLQALSDWNVKTDDVDCIASHGQTIYHAPVTKHQKTKFGNATLQIGDGDHIASKTGILTISDFRQKHTAAGGEGAPLAALVDELLFRDADESRLLLNIGGIANFTYLPPVDSGSNVVTTDTGPGNTLLNTVAQAYLSKPFDKGGRNARRGKVQYKLLEELKNDAFFKRPAPKSTGPELFNMRYIERAQKRSGLGSLSAGDLLATLTHFTVQTMAESIQAVHTSSLPLSVYVSGGGVHNRFMMELLEDALKNASVRSFQELGYHPDAKEAVCFAVLANETLSGDGFQLDAGAIKKNTNLGKISLSV